MERSTATVNRRSPTIRRILREAAEIQKSPSKDFTARPLEEDIFVWHFTLRGPPAPSPFADGFYHGRILLSANYPLRPPMFRFLTPSGRFEVNRDICLSMSGFHEETWQPAWGIRTALVALRAFMDTDSEGQVGGMDSDDTMRKRLAQESRSWRCPECGGGGEEEDMVNAQGDDSETQIPEELKLGYKDQLKGKKQDGENEGTGDGVEGQASAPSGINVADRSANAQPISQPVASASLQTQPADQSGSEQQQLPPPPFLQPDQMLFPSSNYPFPQQNPQEPRDLDALQQEYALLMQQYQAALYSAQFGSQYIAPPPPQQGIPPNAEGASNSPDQQQREAPQQQPVAVTAGPAPAPQPPVAAATAPPPPPPIHTFLHPNQDRGTAMIDVAIGCILGFIALLYFNKMAMTITI